MRKITRITGKKVSAASASNKQKLNRAMVSAASASTRQKLARWNKRIGALQSEIDSINAQLNTSIPPTWAAELKQKLWRLTGALSLIKDKKDLLGK
jgi:uncharacterized coiled-coil DUF342 family protein